MPAREVPIDAQHPSRVGQVRGPVVLVRPEGVASLVPFVPTSAQSGALCHWTAEKPADGWNAPGFDAAGWKEDAAPFGTQDAARTRWASPDLWLRREVTIAAGPITASQLTIFHDEDTEIYINGVAAANAAGFNTSHEEFALSQRGTV